MHHRLFFSFLILIIGFSTLSFNTKKQSIKTIKKHLNHINKFDSWEYDIHYKQKFLDYDDTVNFYVHCRLIKDKSDKHFGGLIWMNNDSIEYYYDLEHIYEIEHKEKKIIKYFPNQGQTWAIDGKTIGHAQDTKFLKKLNIISSIRLEIGLKLSHKDTLIGNNKLDIVTFYYADNDIAKDTKYTYYFDEEGNIKNMFFEVQFQESWQYNEWNISNGEYNTVTKELLQAEFDSLALLYTIEDFEQPDPSEYLLLADGTKAPNFKGLNYQTQDSVSLNDFLGKYVIIDFWFKDCFPCIKAIPILNELRATYSEDNLIILGLNPFDNKDKKIEKLDKFIAYNKMSYPTIFISEDDVVNYKVRSYPSFYIINPEGEIIYSKRGYTESYNKEIKKILKEHLN